MTTVVDQKHCHAELQQSAEEAIRFLDQNGPQDWRMRVMHPVDNWSPATNVLTQIFTGSGKGFAGLVEELDIYKNQGLADAFGYHALPKEQELVVNALWNRFLGFDR